MKARLLLVPIFLVAFAAAELRPNVHSYSAAFAASPMQADENSAPRLTNTMIEPGSGIGPLKIGDGQEQALQHFPKKAEDQEWEDPCGKTFDWVDTTNPMGRGDVFIRFKKGKVFQLESTSTRFHTAEDITTFDAPEKVAKAYRDMRAFVLLSAPVAALGDRPLVFWVDKRKGIAFTFAYDRPRRKRYLYKISVFEPNKTFCPEQETINSSKWQAIPSYATEPPADLSPEL